ECADRLILGIRSRRDDVHDRSEVEVDAGSAKLLPPGGCAALQEGRIPGALHHRGGDLRKARALHRLDQAALLVGGDKETDVGRRRTGDLCLDRGSDGMDGGGAGVASIDEPDRPDVIGLYQVDFGGTETVARESEFEELTDPLIECHRREDLVGAGNLRSRCRSRGWGRGRACRRIRRGPTAGNGDDDEQKDGRQRSTMHPPYNASVFDWVIANQALRAFSMVKRGRPPGQGAWGEGRESDWIARRTTLPTGAKTGAAIAPRRR